MTMHSAFIRAALIPFSLVGAPAVRGQAVDLSAYDARAGVEVRREQGRLHIAWPLASGEQGLLTLRLDAGRPLIEALGVAVGGKPAAAILRDVDPVTYVTVGVRDLSKHGWNVFFDNPPQRPHETFPAVLAVKSARIESHGRSTTVILDGLSAGPFRGDMRFTVYAGCRLVHVEAVMRTKLETCAYLYDAGLVAATPSWKRTAWLGTDDRFHDVDAANPGPAAPLRVRHRAIVAQADTGSVAVFPAPHRFIYPLDSADNYGLVWQGRGYRNKEDRVGLGVRQPPEGDKRWVPWVNAPPGTSQHLGVFYLLHPGGAQDALAEVRRFTHGDRLKKLDGYRTLTSHYHIEHTLDYRQKQREQQTDGIPRGLETPPFVSTFKAHGLDIVHLAEFHVQHTPALNAERLTLLKTMHDECRRLSTDDFLVLPGEEPNVQLGGHWVSLFPRPVNWLLHPKPGMPFEQKVAGFGTVYAVHDAADVLRLMEKENGLMWTAHPRTKGSYGFPDKYRDTDFFRSPHFVGAAFKNMPSDYSKPRLGVRALDLLDDMANWGGRKYLIGEVDIFKVFGTQELYGHLNATYLRLDALPRFDAGWQPILDALRQGRFFVSTGEVLMPEYRVAGKESGQTLARSAAAAAEVTARLEWTFPPAFAEIIWGDGAKVHRQRIDLSAEPAFSSKELRTPVDLATARWVRLEAWDVAANGAFSQPVWIE